MSGPVLRRVVVVGGSIAGATAAAHLRSEGYDGELVMLSEERSRPYSRVPLSKGVLAGTQPAHTALLGDLPDDVELRCGTRGRALDLARRVVVLDGGGEVPYDGLVVATGGQARRIAAHGQRGEHVVRTLDDVAAITAALEAARTAVVVGAGFLGMEVASTLRHHGLAVTVVDREPPLQRVLGPWLAGVLTARAVAAGVDLVTAPEGVRLVGDPVTAVSWAPGQQLAADLVVTAAGDLPSTGWLESSGLRLQGGVVVDAWCRAADGVVAAGDVTAVEAVPGQYRRTPHWSNAVSQARAAARSLLDPGAPRWEPDHYFWTEQFGVSTKVAGHLPLSGDPEVVEGDPGEPSALLRWHSGGQVIAAATVGRRFPVARLKAMVSKR